MSESPGTAGVEDALGIPYFLKVANRNKPFNPVRTTAPEPPSEMRQQEPVKVITTASVKVATAVAPDAVIKFPNPTTTGMDFFGRGTGGVTTAHPGEPIAGGPTPNALSGNTDASIEFLQERAATHPSWHPQLSFKGTDPVTGDEAKGFETASFVRNATGNPDWEKVRHWIDNRQGRGNIYWTVNAAAVMNKKPAKKDILAVVSLHADIDPYRGEHQDEAEVRTVKMIEAHNKVASIVIKSGGGAWAIYDLAAPIQIDGDVAKAEETELFNIQLERELGGDNCHNIDRVARLPGTTNIPNAKKLAKGRRASSRRSIVAAKSTTQSRVSPKPSSTRCRKQIVHRWSGRSRPQRLTNTNPLPRRPPSWASSVRYGLSGFSTAMWKASTRMTEAGSPSRPPVNLSALASMRTLSLAC
jgi:hypothetical protein